MPRERIQHGKLLIGPALDENGEPRTKKVQNAEGMVGETITLGMSRSGQEYFPGMENLSDDERIYEQQSLDVTWNRDASWVQLQIVAPPFWFKQAMRDQSWKEENMPAEFSLSTDVLDRRQINHLISTLRRARDAAYGKDE